MQVELQFHLCSPLIDGPPPRSASTLFICFSIIIFVGISIKLSQDIEMTTTPRANLENPESSMDQRNQPMTSNPETKAMLIILVQLIHLITTHSGGNCQEKYCLDPSQLISPSQRTQSLESTLKGHCLEYSWGAYPFGGLERATK